jgi:Rad52/22 family double-strand break repair protein
VTTEEKRKIYAALAAPFPENAIQRTEGRVTGRGYDTAGIGYQHVVNRLNESVGLGNWRAHRTVTVKQIVTAKGRPAFEAVCDIALELGEWVDGTFVPWAESLSDGGHTAMSEADARKGAFTNGVKKAAAMFGAGKAAYEGTLDDDNVPAESVTFTPAPAQEARTPRPVPTPQPPPPGTPAAPLLVPPPSTTLSRNRLSSKQLGATWAIGRKVGYEQQALRQHIKTTFSVQPEFLSREQASQIIGALSKQAGNGSEDQVREPGAEG